MMFSPFDKPFFAHVEVLCPKRRNPFLPQVILECVRDRAFANQPEHVCSAKCRVPFTTSTLIVGLLLVLVPLQQSFDFGDEFIS
jgi:hypothetical protein